MCWRWCQEHRKPLSVVLWCRFLKAVRGWVFSLDELMVGTPSGLPPSVVVADTASAGFIWTTLIPAWFHTLPLTLCMYVLPGLACGSMWTGDGEKCTCTVYVTVTRVASSLVSANIKVCEHSGRWLSVSVIWVNTASLMHLLLLYCISL